MKPPRWSVQWRSSDSGGESRRAGSAPPPPEIVPDSAPECARGPLCSGKTRDPETGEWHPAPTYRGLCDRDAEHLASCMLALPALWYLAGTLAPARGAARVRTMPGSRVLVNAGADALRQETAAIAGGWAARVRAVPGLRLSAPEHPHGTPARMREDCAVLARHTGQLLALDRGWTVRAYDFPDGAPRTALPDRTTAACRLCGQAITRSAVSGWWWVPLSDERSVPALFCDHDPDPASVRQPPRDAKAEAEARELLNDIGGEEIIRAGDGWVEVLRQLDGTAGALELLEIHWRCQRASGTAPVPPQPLDGVPCRECDGWALVRADAPADPRTEAMWSRCTMCAALMDKETFDAWVAMYNAWAKGSGVLACHRCASGDCGHCFWKGCECAASGHLVAALRPARRASPGHSGTGRNISCGGYLCARSRL